MINNPKVKYRENPSNKEKSIYPVEQYLSLMDYVRNISKHKENSLKDIQNISGDIKYDRYASTWLYVVIHLNNAWRHFDVTLLPRIDLTNTSVKDLDWFKENTLSDDDVDMIVNQLKRKRFKHGKNKKDRRFICSRELKEAFATAAAICELRCKEFTPSSDCLIDFEGTNHDFTIGSHNAFFKDFPKSIEFQSLKANRTLISYMYDVIKKMTNRNPLEITKYIRSHSDVEITNVYVEIPQEHLDFITTQLFGLGNFGYIYDMMSVLVLGEAPEDREERTKQALVMRDLFGSIYKIEELAGYIEALEKEKDVVGEIIIGLSNEELGDRFNLIKLNQMPAKQENYQCLLGEDGCIFKGRDCQQCPLSIPNFYALSSLGDSIAIKVKEFHNEFYSTNLPAEKSRIAKLLYSELALMRQAVTRFGEKEVSFFIKGGIDQLRTETKAIPSLKPYIQVGDYS
ncbi:hypothetical protein [Bacillus sp. PS06]|uniref:hypothetical protein n=1 Tax=Bacillus sp. PS06 TaxID=2764176 RepID=UPI00178291F5|nr:hypothetical protein [Bacillus sp. PS06]MBD8071278.1 hypothetical protein [Bacillus sp. PS06]